MMVASSDSQSAQDICGSGSNCIPSDNPNPNSPPGYITKQQSAFVQSINKVDILVIVDNSGSMDYERRNMAERFGGFIQLLSSQNLDWRVGIITTDVSPDESGGTREKDGRLVAFGDNGSAPYVLRSTDFTSLNAAAEVFAHRIQNLPADEGNGLEQGIKATYRFLERAKAVRASSTSRDSQNLQLLRPDAAFVVIVVSDDNESSEDPGKPESQPREARNDYRNLLSFERSYLGQTKSFSFHSIIVKPQDLACYNFQKRDLDGNIIGGRDNEDYGIDYAAFSQLTGGVIGSVCEADYASQLTILGNRVVQQVNEIVLECAPVDANADGAMDINAAHQETSGSWTQFPASGYKVLGNKFSFNSPAAEGAWQFTYTCVKP